MAIVNTLEWNWDHSIFVDQEITEELVTSLTPQILRLKQKNPATITVGIDSEGGSISAASQLLAVLDSPDLNGRRPKIVTVAVNRAYSAAATLLALGDYAVALPSARIHYHDLRYGTYHDLTSAKATRAARLLQRENDRLALRLAHAVVERLTWIFIDLSKKFEETKKGFPEVATSIDELGLHSVLAPDAPKLDLCGFVCSQMKEMSADGVEVLESALEKLKAWRKLELAFEEFSSTNKPDQDAGALFRDDNPLLAVINAGVAPANKVTWKSRGGLRADLVLMMLLLFKAAAANPALRMTEESITELMTEFSFFREVRKQEHVDKVVDLILKDDYILLSDMVSQKIKNADPAERREILEDVYPQMQTYWAYVVLICRTLFSGEHPISLEDALFLGLVDEIAGRKFPEPRRHIRAKRVAQERREEALSAKPQRKWLRPRTPRS